MPQLGSKKSRRGCQRCRQRRVKCDEQIPCGMCVRRNEQCSLLASPTSSIISEQATDLALPSNRNEWILDLELMYHTTTDLSYLGVREKVVHLWHDYVPQQALKNPFLMHGLLAFAALHLAYLRPSRSSEYLRLCDKHQSIALRNFRSILSSPTDSDLADYLLPLAATISLSSMARSSALSKAVAMDMNAIADLFLLTRGIATVIRLSRKHIMQGPLTEMLEVYTYPEGSQFHLPIGVATRFEALGRMLMSYGLDQDALEHCHSALTELEEIYKNIAYLCQTTNIGIDVLSRWQVRISMEYIRLIQAHSPPALVILAYYAAATTAIRTAWYTQNWAEYALQGISQVLDSEMQDWIEWPKQQMQEGMTVLGVQSPDVFKEQDLSRPIRAPVADDAATMPLRRLAVRAGQQDNAQMLKT